MIVLIDEYWEYKSSIQFIDSPNYMKANGNQLFISGNDGLYKTDQYLNVTQTYQSYGAYYKGLYYNTTSALLYAGNVYNHYLSVFDQNLTTLRTISTGSYIPYSFSFFDDTVYIGTSPVSSPNLGGTILLLRNESIINVYSSICSLSSYITSILIDKYGFMAVTCYSDNMAHLYHINGTNMNIDMSFSSNPTSLAIDSKGRLVINNGNEINIYY